MKIKQSKDYFSAFNTLLKNIIEKNTTKPQEIVLQNIIEVLSFKVFKKIQKKDKNIISITLTKNELMALVYWFNTVEFIQNTFEYNLTIYLNNEYYQILANDYYNAEFKEVKKILK